jgi:hypothetical protein
MINEDELEVLRLLNERYAAQSEVKRLKARIEIQEGISRDLLLQRGELLTELNALKAERDLSQQINCASDHKEALLEAEDKIEELKDQRDRWFNMAQNESENHMRALAELKQLKDHIPDVTKMIKPEPSRLEIAAMFKSAWFANSDYRSDDVCDDGWWIEQADKLIEANKKIIWDTQTTNYQTNKRKN